ncbi:hypothetical protein KY290_036980 [Solanum tuberosum]|uniref:GAG-pre-integrase domain-containing protein n=1 Tax=Solanum tuberosum TaxID=4113 RepID=A0ABQ7TY12_SOLTU|nr:hypothetical protein KY289_036471 [Solanum tuberosum]KAH0738275.1 hypothetical protein KY290_036980 [Solanum tuberosum]
MGDTSQVVTADTNIGVTIVQFNPASQLPIKLLGSQNFSTWKAQFSMLMHGHDLYGHLDGSAPSPSRTITTGTVPSANPAFSLWFRQDQLIQNTLMASVDPTIATAVATANTAKTVWDALHTTYRITGAPITNSELIVKILSGLGPEFREISAAIRAHDSTISYEELYEKLLDHELFLRHEVSKHAPNQITDAAATSNRSGHSNSRNTRRPNNGSNQQWRSNNRSTTPNQCRSSTTTNSYDGVRCQLCNKPGHVASVCRSKSHNHFEAKVDYVSGLQAPADSWIVDSGASHHITVEPHNLQAYNGMKHDLNTGTPLVHGRSRDGLYEWPTSPSVPSPQAYAASSNSSSIITWHRRLGHPHARLLHTPLNELLLPNDDIDILLKRQEHYSMKPHFPRPFGPFLVNMQFT